MPNVINCYVHVLLSAVPDASRVQSWNIHQWNDVSSSRIT